MNASPMKITIGKFDPATGTVPVTFRQDGKAQTRAVNAVLDEGGSYDRKATKLRAEEVGEGVAHKFALGVAGNDQIEEV